jgi:hypothetical protein
VSIFHKANILALIDRDIKGKIYVTSWLDAVPPSKRGQANAYALKALHRLSGQELNDALQGGLIS